MQTESRDDVDLTREAVDLLKSGADHVLRYHELWGVAGFFGGLALAVLFAGAGVFVLYTFGPTAKAVSGGAILFVCAAAWMVVAGLSFARCFEPVGSYLQRLWDRRGG